MLTKKERARYSAIVRQLSAMSSNGWDRATHDDYAPLEAELAALGEKMIQMDQSQIFEAQEHALRVRLVAIPKDGREAGMIMRELSRRYGGCVS
jgi:hypothetical protein